MPSADKGQGISANTFPSQVVKKPVQQSRFDYCLNFPSGNIAVSTGKMAQPLSSVQVEDKQMSRKHMWDREPCDIWHQKRAFWVEVLSRLYYKSLSHTPRKTNKTSLPQAFQILERYCF